LALANGQLETLEAEVFLGGRPHIEQGMTARAEAKISPLVENAPPPGLPPGAAATCIYRNLMSL
jgi:hypothetical protein